MGFVSKYLSEWTIACGLLLLLPACGGDEPVQAGSCSPGASTACTCPDGVTRGNAACTASGALGVCSPCANAPRAGSMATAGSGGMVGTTAGTGTAGVGTAGVGTAGINGAAGTTTAPRAGAGGSANAGAAGGMAGVSGRAGAGAGAGAGGAPAPLSCGPGEMCLMSVLGGVKFCSMDAAAVLPPVCTAGGTACGSNGRGVCLDAASVGFPGMLFCIYTAC